MNKQSVIGWVALVAMLTGLSYSAGADDHGVLIIGDSMMKSVSRAFKKECARRKLAVQTFTSIGTGLARSDVLNWQDKAKELVDKYKPETVLVMMGANDNQALRGGGATFDFGTPGWKLEYGRRCGKLMDTLIAGGVKRVVWLGLPCMREKKLNEDIIVINRIIKQQAAARPQVQYISTYKMFSKKNKYSAYIIQSNGMPLDVRGDDGIHFNNNGANYLVKQAGDKIFGK